MKAIVFILFFLISSCVIEKPENKEYEPFSIVTLPENRIFFPEEKITFVFNMDVNPLSLKGFSATETESGTELDVAAENDTVSIIPPLPAASSVSVLITSALKSIGNKPLMTGDSFPENKETIKLEFQTGKKLPEIESVIPSDTQSATVGIGFDGNVEVKFKDIEPKPFDMIKIENWLVFIYQEPVRNINILKARSIDRDMEIENIKIDLPSKKPVKSDLDITYHSTDTEITVEITDKSAIAVSVNGVNFMCDEKCVAQLSNLTPETNYSVDTNVYTTTGIKSSVSDITTGEERPRIIISEVMHTPSSEPEKNWEFVEILNSGTMDFDLADCFIDDKNDGKGIDPLLPKDIEKDLILKPGEIAVITGNEASFGDIIAGALWLTVDDTTIADAGLTSTESVEIICKRDDSMVTVAHGNPAELKTKRGFSYNLDKSGRICSSIVEGGTPGKYYECE